MKIPEKAPNWGKVLKVNWEKLSDINMLNEISKIVQKANKDYLYWDRFKYLSVFKNITPELAWSYLKLTRNSQLKTIPLKNTNSGNFGYWIPDSVLKELHYCDKYVGGEITTEYPTIIAQERTKYLVHSIIDEAIASSQLEGAVATRKVAKEMIISGRKPKNRAEQMILNNYNTIRTIKQFIDKPLTPELICYFQESITKDTLDEFTMAGHFRKKEDNINVVDERDGTILHTPPSAIELPDRIKLLCEFANINQEDEFIHPIIKGIILHFWLAYDHPFVDGNGRTARTLFYWYMLKNKYWLYEYLSISRIILKAPGQYARAFLYSELDGQDISYFILFHLRIIHLAIEELRIYLDRKQKEIKKSTTFLRNYPGLSHRQQDLLYHALTHGDTFYTIEAYKKINGIVYQTARADLIDLVKKGFLFKRLKGRAFVFYPKENLSEKLNINKEG